MNTEEWEYYRQLEKQLVALQHEITRLHESNAALQRINGFIFSAIIVEMVMILFKGM